MTSEPRVLIGTLYSGENEFEDCLAALASQEYSTWDHQVFRHLPNREAHETIYGTFAQSRDHDLFLKLDADMVFRTPTDLGDIVKLFGDEGLDHLQLAVHDWFSDQRIMGIHAYRQGVQWRTGQEDLFVDPYPEIRGRRLDLQGEPGPVIDHCPNPAPYQAFHFGVHRALKALQPGRRRGTFDAHASRAQFDFLHRTRLHFQRCQDHRLGLALLGAEMILTGEIKLQRVEKKGEEVLAAFERCRNLDLEVLNQRLTIGRTLLDPGAFGLWRRTTWRGFGGNLARLLAPPLPRKKLTKQKPPGLIQPELTALVVNYNCASATLKCVNSIRTQAPHAPLVIVDNGSTDDSVVRLQEAFSTDPEVTILAEALNHGFGGGCNRGFQKLLDKHPDLGQVLLLNPDAVLTDGCIEALSSTAQRHPEAGIIGGKVMDATGTKVQFENGRIRPWTLTRMHVPAPAVEEFKTTFITGALMLVAGDLLRAGLRFDETYFLYVEDLDLCREVAKRGRSLWLNSKAVIKHIGGAALAKEKPLGLGAGPTQLLEQTRGKVIFARKHLPVPQRLVFLAIALLAKPLVGLIHTRSTRFLGPYLKGLCRGLRAKLS